MTENHSRIVQGGLAVADGAEPVIAKCGFSFGHRLLVYYVVYKNHEVKFCQRNRFRYQPDLLPSYRALILIWLIDIHDLRYS